jgi:branched-chain amino acid transport system substrate-binding protein
MTNIYQGCPSETWYGKGFVPLMQSWIDSGAWKPSSKTVAIVTSNDPYSISIAQAFRKSVEGIGWTVPIYEEVTAPNADWGPVLTKIRSNPPGLIYVTDYIPGDLASFAKQFADSPTKSLLYQQYGPSIPEYLELAGSAGYGVVWSTTVGTLPDDLGQAFLDLYQKKYNAKAGLSQAGAQYDLVRMWAQTVGMVGDPYKFEQINKLLKNVAFRGVSGTFRWISDTELAAAPYPDLKNDPSLAMPHMTYQIQDGKQVPVFPEPYATGAFQLPKWLA